MKDERPLDERAMEYAIVAHGIDPDRAYGTFSLRLETPLQEWQADDLKHKMFRDFDIYAVTQAIKRAEEIVLMVLPKTQE